MGAQLPEIETEYLTAYRAKVRAYRVAMDQWPLAPASLVQSSYGSHHNIERDISGAGISRPGKQSATLYTLEETRETVEILRKAVARKRKYPDRPFGVPTFWGPPQPHAEWQRILDQYEDRLAAAERYYSRIASIRASCGYHEAEDVDFSARAKLIAHVSAIMNEDPRTTTGVLIQAAALAAFGKVETAFRVMSVDAWPWLPKFAEGVLRTSQGIAAAA